MGGQGSASGMRSPLPQSHWPTRTSICSRLPATIRPGAFTVTDGHLRGPPRLRFNRSTHPQTSTVPTPASISFQYSSSNASRRLRPGRPISTSSSNRRCCDKSSNPRPRGGQFQLPLAGAETAQHLQAGDNLVRTRHGTDNGPEGVTEIHLGPSRDVLGGI
jgi:hypothetical protein